ncbi:uncharacterized protein LOC129276286 [Lytechinus pictus]|uniref:uncharacterized protein LOC121427631 n=1 Tax=Lytechinus variegatus TaxID=7654 RepID=UPI001BB1CBEC|nr:uncharacterized protein LOC121427631 [Lytechinus variegatus]
MDCLHRIMSSLILLFLVFFLYSLASDGSVCTYYIDARYSKPESGLPNCSWYNKNACCKRTEVAAVLGSMFKVDQATNSCRYHLNYMMCYFCSPEQINWYDDTRLYICSEFCEATFEECKTAYYKSELIGDQYRDGKAFCEANSFHVVPGRERCFNYDPTVFANAPLSVGSIVLTLGLSALVLFSVLK